MPRRAVTILALLWSMAATGQLAGTDPGHEDELGQALLLESSSLDAELEARVLGVEFIAPAVRSSFLVRSRQVPDGIAPRRTVPTGRAASVTRRVGAEECEFTARKRPADDWWSAKVRTPIQVSAAILSPVTPVRALELRTVESTRANAWCANEATRPGPLEPLGRAVWGPLLLVALGTALFWITRGLRAP